MNRKIKILSIKTVLLLFFAVIVNAQNKVGTTSFQFLKVMPGTRTTALGQSVVSFVNGAESMFSNPAGIAEISNYEIQISHLDWFIDTKIYSAAVAFNLGYFTVGVFGSYWDYGQIAVTDVAHLKFSDDYTYFNPGLTGQTINPSAQYVGVSFARKLTNKFNFGLSLKYVREDLIAAKSSVFAFDGGLSYETGYKSIKLGGSINNFGLSEVKFLDRKDVIEVNQNYNPAVDSPEDSLITKTINGESFPIPQTFAFGVSAYLIAPGESLFLHDDNMKLLVAYQIQHPRDYDMQHNIGLEFTFMDIISLRGGYKFNYDEESYTFGVGLRYSGFDIGYAYDPFGEILDSVHRFSISFRAD
jgi:hypothetical protein